MAEPAPARLPFAFARDQQVLLDGARLIAGPAATTLGYREAQRRAGAGPLALEACDQAGFDMALARFYQAGDAATGGGDDALSFDLEDTGGGAARDLLEDATEAPVIRLVARSRPAALPSGVTVARARAI